MTGLDAFIIGYTEAALWTESIGEQYAAEWARRTGEAVPSADTGLLDFGFTAEDIAPEALEAIRAECDAFVRANRADLEQYAERREYDPNQGAVWTYAGHDFWLTRNGHGAGFWDRGLGDLGERLTTISKPYGESHLYVGDDGKVYVA